MYKYMLLIFLNLGIHSHFVPLKITTSHTPHNISGVVKEIVSLLNKTHENTTEFFTTPTNITCPTCSHKYANEFIHELHKIKKDNHVSKIEVDMEYLKKICPFLEKSPVNHSSCESQAKDFNTFKEDLKRFLYWINEKNICNEMNKVDKCLQNITVLKNY